MYPSTGGISDTFDEIDIEHMSPTIVESIVVDTGLILMMKSN